VANSGRIIRAYCCHMAWPKPTSMPGAELSPTATRRAVHGSGERKECHAGIGKTGVYGRSTPPSNNGFKRESGIPALGVTSLPLSMIDRRLAILVNQGSDPTVPYQALAIRESAMLF
jgi:hypothetical protein